MNRSWMDGLIDGLIDGCMGGWKVNGWMDG